MTDSLKFGPEWLRNLSQDGPTTGSGGGGPRYQLAEHRYGREEMLALFDRTLGQPELLGRFKSLYVERLQLPLALAPTQDDENRGWMPRPMAGGLSGVRGTGRGGVSVDRGRGRGGRGSYHSQGGPNMSSAPYQRSQSSFEPDEVGLRITTRQPTRPWSEQNGEAEWNGSTSPRKEYSTTGRANMDNWRRHRGTEEDDGWRNQPEPRRPDKWNRGAPSWRDGETDGSGDRELSRGFERLERELRERGASERGDRAPPPAVTRSWNARKPWDVDDILPEWAMENPSESGGTFDASGAFHGSDDEQERGGRLNHSHSTNNMQSPRPAPLSRSQTQGSIAVNKQHNITDTSKPRSKEHPSTELSHSEEDLYQHRKEEKGNKQSSNSTRNNKPDREISIEHLDHQDHQKSVPNNLTEIQKSTPSRTQSPTIKNVSQQSTPKKSLKESDASKIGNEGRKNDTNDSEKNSTDNILANQKKLVDDLTKSKFKQYVGASQEPEEVKKIPETPKQSAPHDEFARMQEVADDIVAQLMMDDERSPVVPVVDPYKVVQPQQAVHSVSPLGSAMVSPPTVHNVMPILPVSVPGSDKWFYRDPQGEVQGPFLANEMGEWYRAGYFTNELMVRRACDERYTTLGELLKICGGVIPFSPSARLPPLKVDPAVNNALPPTPAGLIPGSAQYRQAQLLSRQIAARHEAQAQVLRDLSRSERWATMTPGEQNAVLMQHLSQIPFPDTFAPPSVPAGLGIPPIVPMAQTTPASNPLLQLISQMQQAKQPSNIMSQVPTIDPLKQSAGAPHMNHLSGLTGHPNIPMPTSMNHNNALPNHINNTMHNPALNQVLNQTVPISSAEQMNQNANIMESMQKGDDLMSMFKQFFTKMGNKPAESASWNPSWSNTNSIGSMWDMQIPKPEMKTEQQILEEQLRHRKEAEEKENREKEHKRQLEEAQAKNKQQEKAKKQAEIEEKLKAQKEAEERQKEEQKRKEQDKKKAEEKEKRESERIKKELEKAKREAEEKRLRELEEKRRLKEERKREEELRRDSEKRKAEEALRIKEQEEEARRLAAEEELRRKAAEAKRIQEQQRQAPKVAPWRPPADPTVSNTSSLSLAEIQRLEKEKRAEQLKEQAQQQALRQQQAALLKEQELAAANERSAMQLKWANQKPQVSNKVKSLAEIQAEEMAKQAAADKLAAAQRERESPVVQQTNSIWSSAPSLNWTSTAWTSNTGFWDEAPTQSPTVAVSQPKTTKASPKAMSILVNNSPSQNKTVTPNKSANNQNTSNHNGGQKSNLVPTKLDKNATANNNNNLNKKKKNEKDDFTNWCTKAMSSINNSVDVPTFIGFLNDIDSPYEVKDYIRTYLGDSKEAIEFSKQFLERRSRFRNQQRLATAHIDDMCSPAPAINPGSEFHEQGKGKKSKKNKMQKIDNRILGFNVTAAQDRINIGDRDYGDAN